MNCTGFEGGGEYTEGSLPGCYPWNCPEELREQATRTAVEGLAGTPSGLRERTWRIAEELGVHPEVLHTWVKKAEIDAGARPGTTSQDAARIRGLERALHQHPTDADGCCADPGAGG